MKENKKKKSPRPVRLGFNEVVYRQPDYVIDAASGLTLLMEAILKEDHERVAGLLEAGADPCKADKKGRSPLHYAAKQGQLEMIGLLFKHGARANPRDKNLATPLFDALESARPLETVECLLAGGGDANIPDKKDRVPLHAAAQSSGADVVRCLVRATEAPSRPDKDSFTPLHRACKSNTVEVVRMILSEGVPVFAADISGNTPLHLAIVRQDSALAEYLLTTPAASLVNAADINGTTPLHLAARDGKVDIIQGLLRLGADPNQADRSGETPLLVAVRSGNEGTVRLLIDSGADLLKNPRGRTTPLILAVEYNRMEVLRFLVKMGCDVNAAAADGMTSLLQAAKSSNKDTISFLLEAGADPNLGTVSERPLHAAVLRDDAVIVKALLDKGANPNTKIRNGQTPLHLFLKSWRSNIQVVQVLLDAGADPLVKDLDGMNAIDIEYERQNRQPFIDLFKRVLLKKGVVYKPKKPSDSGPGFW